MPTPASRKRAKRWERIWTGLKIYLVIVGLFSFPMFILEESTQVAIWGTWQAKDDMATLLEGMEVVEDINAWEWRINLSLGWLQPIGFKSYQGWCRATDYWIEATQARILTKEPELLEGRTIRLRFNPKYTRNLADKTVLEYGNVQIELPEPPDEGSPPEAVPPAGF